MENQNVITLRTSTKGKMLIKNTRSILVDRSELLKHIRKLDWMIRNPKLVHLTEKNLEYYKGKKKAFEEILEGLFTK